ncbi:MAG: ABC transporter substrate-binding protein [Sterolibacterium sp.]
MMPNSRRRFIASLSTLPLLPALFPRALAPVFEYGALAMLTACNRPPAAPLAIAAHLWPGYEPMFLARRERWLDERQVRLVETLSATNSLQLLAAGKIDGAALTLDEVLRGRSGGMSLAVVLVFDISAGADVLLVRPGIDELAALKGRRIGVEQGALGALMFAKVLQAAGLMANEVRLVPLTVAEQFEAWQRGKVDAVVTCEPVASQLVDKGAVRLFDSRQIPDLIVDVLALRTAAIDSHAEAIRHLLAAHFRALEHLHRNSQDAAYRMAGRLKLAPEQVLVAFKGLVLPDIANNRRLLAGARPPLLAGARTLSALMLKEGLLPRNDTLANLLNADFLPHQDLP